VVNIFVFSLVFLSCFAFFGNARAEDFELIYRDHIDNFNEKKYDEFFSMYASDFCFHDKMMTPDDLKKTYSDHFSGRGHSIKIEKIFLLSESLHEARIWSIFWHKSKPVTHLILFKKEVNVSTGNDLWFIAQETNPNRLKCAHRILDGLPNDLRSVIQSSARQIQKISEVIDREKSIYDIKWDDIYCANGFEPTNDSTSDHEYNHDSDGLLSYCLNERTECRRDHSEEQKKGFYMYVDVVFLGSSEAERFNLVLMLYLDGNELFSLSIDQRI
jgi:hypothetical protein